MKTTGSKIIVFAVLIGVVVLMAFTLKSNRSERENEVTISQRKVDKIAILTEKIQRGTLSENVTASGVLEASEVLNLVSETQGKIIKIYKQKGDRVATGEVIVKVDDEVISANVLTAEANFAQFERDLERLTRLAEENAVTKRDLEQTTIGLKKAKADLITARKALNNTSIKAPISGYINNDFVTVGQLLGGGAPVCEIVNNSLLKINIKITEHEVYKINVGQTVAIRLTAFPDKTFSGKIASIAEKADNAMKFNVEISLQNDKNAHLRSGLYAEVVLPVKNEEKLIIQKAAIVGSMEKPVVYVAIDGKAVKREIVTGQSSNDLVEVLSGLSEGEELVVSGQLNIRNGDEVKNVK